jgi:hypothetical protein
MLCQFATYLTRATVRFNREFNIWPLTEIKDSGVDPYIPGNIAGRTDIRVFVHVSGLFDSI